MGVKHHTSADLVLVLECQPRDIAMQSAMEDMPSATATNGIDIRQALDILADRTSCSHKNSTDILNKGHSSSENSDRGCGGCTLSNNNHGGELPNEAKSMGQTIDLNLTTKEKNHPSATTAKEEKQLGKERTERLQKIRVQLQHMTFVELIQAVLQAQQDRVLTYKVFDSGLEKCLQVLSSSSDIGIGGGMALYPSTCAKATASFSVLSDTMNAIRDVLVVLPIHKNAFTTHATTRAKTIKKVCRTIDSLQAQEKMKLNLTAALHLERLRAECSVLNDHCHSPAAQQQPLLAQPPPQEDQTAQLLQNGVRLLKKRVNQCEEQINGLLEELRYVSMEEQE